MACRGIVQKEGTLKKLANDTNLEFPTRLFYLIMFVDF